MKQEIRIIGGLYKGKKINFPETEGLRPTPGRVRETLFNWLMHVIQDARCLDAFAGSGALGLEAFSRGAAQITLIEQSATAHAQLKKIIMAFNSPKLKLIHTDTKLYFQKQHEPFDLIFLDPPFTQDIIPQCLHDIAKNNILAQDGLVYVESANIINIDKNQWQQIKLKQAGQVVYGLFKKL
ncbi:MAG: 16S rRNA (guanine(966)-N(2))-methyltransferase RsmD [Legionellales bacterium]